MENELKTNGYMIVENVFTDIEINEMRKIALAYFKNGGGFKNSGGAAKPDFIKVEMLKPILSHISNKKLDNIIEDIIGEPVEFISHNDLHINRDVGWHKDILQNEAQDFWEDPWEIKTGDTMKIYKVNIYLQDHTIREAALQVRMGSHLNDKMGKGKGINIKPKTGDIVIFDQRIDHRGSWSKDYTRILICMGYGVNNSFFNKFKEGTELRQNIQNNKGKQTTKK